MGNVQTKADELSGDLDTQDEMWINTDLAKYFNQNDWEETASKLPVFDGTDYKDPQDMKANRDVVKEVEAGMNYDPSILAETNDKWDEINAKKKALLDLFIPRYFP